MIIGGHSIIYSANAEADRAFFATCFGCRTLTSDVAG